MYNEGTNDIYSQAYCKNEVNDGGKRQYSAYCRALQPRLRHLPSERPVLNPTSLRLHKSIYSHMIPKDQSDLLSWECRGDVEVLIVLCKTPDLRGSHLFQGALKAGKEHLQKERDRTEAQEKQSHEAMSLWRERLRRHLSGSLGFLIASHLFLWAVSISSCCLLCSFFVAEKSYQGQIWTLTLKLKWQLSVNQILGFTTTEMLPEL